MSCMGKKNSIPDGKTNARVVNARSEGTAFDSHISRCYHSVTIRLHLNSTKV
jgi:hypothetical protein